MALVIRYYFSRHRLIDPYYSEIQKQLQKSICNSKVNCFSMPIETQGNVSNTSNENLPG